MNKTTSAFSQRESNIYKGIAVILMLFHHLFFDQQDYEAFTEQLIFSPFTDERIRFFASLSKICVVIFVFVTGYGLTVTYRKNFHGKIPSAKELWAFIWQRYWKLMTAYWFVFLLSLIFQPLGRTIFDTYGNKPRGMLVYFLLDFFGLASFHLSPTLNPTWWYISLAIAMIFLVPIMLRLMQSLGTFPVAISAFLLLLLSGIQNQCTFCLCSLLLGIISANCNLLEKTLPSTKKGWCLAIPLELAAFLFLLSLRTNYNYSGIIDGFITLAFALLVQSVFSRLSFISSFLEYLGRHSANIFMTHTFLYYYYFQEFFYSFRHWFVILAALLLASVILSIAIEWIKKKTHYTALMKKLGHKLELLLSCEEI